MISSDDVYLVTKYNLLPHQFVPGMVVMVRANVKFSLEYLKPLDDPLKDDDRFTF